MSQYNFTYDVSLALLEALQLCLSEMHSRFEYLPPTHEEVAAMEVADAAIQAAEAGGA